ncbi:MAG: uroporphyrinogen-III synthase, partial [Proteobacteria bacterium]|nr:uroporphyrinogen-III synthase [Pseudomonadota bacterium]
MSETGLTGCGVLITRPEHQSQELAAGVKAAGGTVFHFPAFDIIGRDMDEIRRKLTALPEPDIVVFVSRNAVAHGLAAVKEFNAKIAAVGPATRHAIESDGETVDIFPESGFDSEHLLTHAALQDVDGRNVMIVRGQSGRELLAETLRERGANVDYVCVYERTPYEPTPAELEHLESALGEGRIRFVTVMSVETLECLVQIMPSQALSLLRQSTLVAPGTRVLQTASELIPGIATVAVQQSLADFASLKQNIIALIDPPLSLDDPVEVRD